MHIPNTKTLNHLAIIMDGNSRWAASKDISTYLGHKQGASNAKKIIQAVQKHNISHLSLYAFSSENWNRPPSEVNLLMKLLKFYINSEKYNLYKSGIKLSIIGDLSKLDESIRLDINEAVELTKSNNKMHLYLAISYGGQEEIVSAYKKILESNISPESLTVENFHNFLYDRSMPPIDFIIRTGGNIRVSNFLLWHSSYSELYFIPKYWPEFSPKDLEVAIKDYQSRTRTFGKR